MTKRRLHFLSRSRKVQLYESLSEDQPASDVVRRYMNYDDQDDEHWQTCQEVNDSDSMDYEGTDDERKIVFSSMADITSRTFSPTLHGRRSMSREDTMSF